MPNVIHKMPKIVNMVEFTDGDTEKSLKFFELFHNIM